MINVGIVGYGYWGPNLVRNFSGIEGCRIKTVSDLEDSRLRLLKKNYSSVIATKSAAVIFKDKNIDAVIIATPISTHFKLAKSALENGKHVLVEKPMTFSSLEGNELVKLAKKNNKILMVDHTFIYSPAVRKIKWLIDEHKLGTIKYIDSTRINLGLFQKDANVLWDLAVHDLSIVFYLLNNKKPLSIQAIGSSLLKNDIENTAYLILKFKSGLIIHFNCSWFSPVKIRMMLIAGDKKMILWNDLEPTEKIKIYNKGCLLKTDEDKRKVLIGYREGDIYVPKIEVKEALSEMAQDFISSIEKGVEPISNGNFGLQIIKFLEFAQKSIKNHGKEIKFKN